MGTGLGACSTIHYHYVFVSSSCCTKLSVIYFHQAPTVYYVNYSHRSVSMITQLRKHTIFRSTSTVIYACMYTAKLFSACYKINLSNNTKFVNLIHCTQGKTVEVKGLKGLIFEKSKYRGKVLAPSNLGLVELRVYPKVYKHQLVISYMYEVLHSNRNQSIKVITTYTQA